MEAKRRRLPFGRAAAESDKDSRFSDGSSDHLNSAEPTNLEDAVRTPSQSPEAAGNSLAVSFPVVVMKNSADKQGENSPQFQSWTVQPSWETIPAHQQLVVLHPPIPSIVTLQAARGKIGDSSDSLPISNSYAEIAPQSYKRSLEDREETRGQKRLCINWVGTSPNQVNPLPSSLCHQGALSLRPLCNSVGQDLPGRNVAVVNGSQPVSFMTSNALACGSLSSTPAHPKPEGQAQDQVQSASCNPLVSRKEHFGSADLPSQQPSNVKRFQNTLVVLHKSGLLEIMLKTKKLIGWNQVTQMELDQLKWQTQLFMEALENNAPQTWAELEASLMQSDKAFISSANVTSGLVDSTSAVQNKRPWTARHGKWL